MHVRSTRRQIAIWEIMVLIAGAAVGLAVAKITLTELDGTAVKVDFRQWWAWLLLAYAVVLGMTMAMSGMLVVDRFRTGYRWRAGAMAWFAIGCVAWLYAAFTVADIIFFKQNPVLIGFRLELLTGGLHVGGIVLFLTYIASGRAVRHWWRGGGWWPEWTGMWLLGLASIGGTAGIAALVARNLF